MRCDVLMAASGCGKSSVGRVPEPVRLLHLDAPPHVMLARVSGCAGHVFPPALLVSQFAALEGFSAGARGTRVSIARPFGAVVGETEFYVRETLI